MRRCAAQIQLALMFIDALVSRYMAATTGMDPFIEELSLPIISWSFESMHQHLLPRWSSQESSLLLHSVQHIVYSLLVLSQKGRLA